MNVKLPTEHHLEFLSLKGGCRGSSEYTLVKMSNCWNLMPRLLIPTKYRCFTVRRTGVGGGGIKDNFSQTFDEERQYEPWHEISNILTSVDSDEPLQPHFKLRNSKWCSVSSLTIIENSSD